MNPTRPIENLSLFLNSSDSPLDEIKFGKDSSEMVRHGF